MFVECENGDLVNLDNALFVHINRHGLVEVLFTNGANEVIFAGSDKECREYMSELKKELAAFGKLIQVKMD